MINLEADNKIVRWFVWCCDHLPCTVTREYGEGKPSDGLRRSGAYYVTTGTTLCHMFWAMLWVPLVLAIMFTYTVFMFVMAHVIIATNPDRYGHTLVGVYGPVAYLALEGWILLIVLVVAVSFLAILGGTKSGFFNLLGLYLRGVKNCVCPLIRFEVNGCKISRQED